MSSRRQPSSGLLPSPARALRGSGPSLASHYTPNVILPAHVAPAANQDVARTIEENLSAKGLTDPTIAMITAYLAHSHGSAVPCASSGVNARIEACKACHRARKKCKGGIPCERCVERGTADACERRPRRARGNQTRQYTRTPQAANARGATASRACDIGSRAQQAVHGNAAGYRVAPAFAPSYSYPAVPSQAPATHVSQVIGQMQGLSLGGALPENFGYDGDPLVNLPGSSLDGEGYGPWMGPSFAAPLADHYRGGWYG